MPKRIGFDVGGTFTDFVLKDEETGELDVYKYPTTVDDPSQGVLTGLDEFLTEVDSEIDDLEQLIHATTLATNTVLERDGADTALLTTEGFRDVPILGRQKRYDLYDLFIEKPDPIVDRENIYEVDERLHPREGVVTPLDEDELASLVEDIEDDYESVAVSFLHSYEDDRHERAATEVIEDVAPDLYTTRASGISKQYREYERTNTALVDAYVKPTVQQYLSKIEEDLDGQGYDGSFFMMKSSGGVATPKMIQQSPVQIIESGPVAGALNAAHIGEHVGHENVFSFDMGGTTAKICFIIDGQPKRTDVFEVDEAEMKEGSGLPINLTVIDMIEISAGGGSIAAASDTGRITVGPESSGAEPGPICYGRGGTQPTVTDADLALGYLNPDYFLGGRMDIDVDDALAGIDRDIAEPLGMDTYDAAWGVKEIVDNAMTRASQIHASERGIDPREFGMIAFGGAGPSHAAFIAHELNVPKVIVPPGAGVASAGGLLVADIEFHLDQTYITELTPDGLEHVNDIYDDLEARGRELVKEAGGDDTQIEVEREADMKYVGQAHELGVELPTGALGSDDIETIEQRFHDTYERTYGYSDEDEEIEGITWKVTVRSPTESMSIETAESGSARASDARKGTREAYFKSAGGFTDAGIYDREELSPGAELTGPAVIEEVNSTTVVPPGDVLTVDEYGNLVIEINEVSDHE
ncbi:hydantoinase/oxoprolinase family protein [Natrialba sp. INN-245]|uniref:hydantoinase/oxoprolinase family protein n=1 Tax=Natrialba sp. INN-245 TaxID=2690967 RepID=UPI00130F7D08|nr:hydantoinase/oxoprolinase family protein [Natrialba sp. INN-245]MWV38431.1 hydantoinase/oxoprolinase family protein [Natrialba sp. INN-245]